MDIGGDEIDKILLNAGAALNAQQNGGDNPDVNISDVLDAIDRAESSHTVDDMSQSVRPYVEITEQPASKEIRFRYECEGRSAGSIPGATSTPENKTYPAIKIHGYLGPATIVASCITKEGFLVHPHNLVGKNCNQGVCSFRVTVKEDAREFQFKNVGIQCVKRQNITTAINNRMRHGIDPFRKGFEHQNNPLKIDLNCVRLAIQVIVKDERGNDVSLRPVFTNVIFDKKSSGDLLITRASHCSGPAGGGTQVILLCNKLVQGARDDTVVAFYELAGDAEVWTKEVAPSLVHKQYAIVFEVPAYRDPLADRHVTVRYQLRRRSDRECSNWLPFEYIPAAPDSVFGKRKKTIPSMIQSYHKPERILKPEPRVEMVKQEPREIMTPHQMTSPPHQMFTYSHPPDTQWGEPAGGSKLQAFGQTLPWSAYPQQQHVYGQSPAHGQHSPALGQHSPALCQHSPALGQGLTPLGQSPSLCVSPGLAGHVSPNMMEASPAVGHPSPMGHLSPMGHHSPMGHVASPGLGHTSPGLAQHDARYGHISPGLQQQPVYQMLGQPEGGGQLSRPAALEQAPSLSELLAGDPELLAALDDRDGLSDSLNRLSTGDLWPHS